MSKQEDEFGYPARVIDPPRGQFPALSVKVHSQLSNYMKRSESAIASLLNAARQRTEFYEDMANKVKQDLESEKQSLTRITGEGDQI